MDALALKEIGNSHFRKQQYAEARQVYIDALGAESEIEPAVAVVLNSNCAECCLRLRDWADSLQHAAAALELDASHAKSAARKARAETAIRLAQSLPAGQFPAHVCADAVASMEQLPRSEANPMARVQFLASADQGAAEQVIAAMLQMTPSLYEAMHVAVHEDIQMLHDRINQNMPISLAHPLLTTVLRGNRSNDRADKGFDHADSERCVGFLKTGAWPTLLTLLRTMFDETQHSSMLLNMITKPVYRFIGYMMCHPDCAEYVLSQHCQTAAEIHQLTDLMFLGEGDDISACEGLINQMAAVGTASTFCFCTDDQGAV